MRHAGKEPFPVIYVDAKEEGQVSKMCTVSSILYLFEIRVFLYSIVTSFVRMVQ
jgi:hypothetical protein